MADKKNLPNPFPGLRPFQSDEEHLFFGRESQTLELLQLLRDNRFVGVIGTSGSGKSSLVRCGLLSELYGGSFLEAGTDWEVAVMNPGGGPFNQLSKSLVDADIYDSAEADVNLKLNATLRRSRLGLVEAIRQAKLPEGTNFLLVVDQFEEIFRYSEAGEEEGEAADDFISMILEAAKQSNIPIYVIITMRSDYIGDCSKFEGLPEEINEGEYLIPRLSREEYKSVIEGPIRVGGAKLAPRLLQRLLNDIGTESDQLPCLQHALMRTWDAWADREDAEELDLEDYRAIGGMGKALSIHADEIFDTFDDEATRETATRMFRAITEKGDDNRGIRRPLRLQQLADITNHSIEEVKSVVDPYRQQGVTFLMPPSDRELEADTVIDISHESLMRVWQRLRNWVEEEAQSARIYRRLVDTSSLWKKEEAGLYYDPDLQIAQSWRDKYQPNADWADLYGGGFKVATQFLEASEEEGRRAEREKELARQKELEQAQELAEARERSARNMKRFAAVVGVVAFFALGAMVFAVKQQKVAETAQKTAIAARSVAETAKETLRKEFINSDINLGLSFSEQGQPGRGLAHFARALEREPNSPSLIDRSFNILSYTKAPGYRSPKLNFESNYIETSQGSADGSTVLTAIYRNNEENNQTPNLMVWKPKEKKPLHSIYVGPGRFRWGNDIAISPDGKTAALALNGLHILNIEKGTIKSSTESNTLQGVKYSTDGKRLLTGTGQREGNANQIWNAETGELIKTYLSKAFYPVWSPDETKILYPRHRVGQSAVIDIATESVKAFKHEGIPRMKEYGTFDRTGNRFLSVSDDQNGDQRFNVWNIESGELEYSVKHPTINNGFTGSVGVFTPDNQKIITVGHGDLTVKLWSSIDGTPIDSINIAKTPAFNQAPIFSADGKRIMFPLQNGQTYTGTFDEVYSKLPELDEIIPLTEAHAFLANDGRVRPLLIPSDHIISGVLVPNENSMLIGKTNGSAVIYDLSTGETKSEDIAHLGEIRAVAISNDGKTIATASNWGSVKIWNRESLSTPVQTIGSDDPNNPINYHKLHFTSDGKELWANNGSGAKKWNVETGDLVVDTKIRPTMSASVNSKDGAYTAITRWGIARVFDNSAKSDKEPIAINGGGTIDALCFSSDNKYLITGTKNGKIRMWSNSDGTQQKTRFDLELAGSPENINSIALSPDSKLIAAGCKSGNVYIFELENESDRKERSSPQGEVFRSDLITKETPGRAVDIDVSILGAKKLYLVVEEGDDGWQHDIANWAEPRIIIGDVEKKLTEIAWTSATADWGSAQVNRDAGGFAMTIDGKDVSYGIGTHANSIIEFDLPEGAERFKARGGIDDNVIGPNNRSSLRFSVYTTAPPKKEVGALAIINGSNPCNDLRFSDSGKLLAAAFTDNESSYAQVWEAGTAFPLTEKLQNGTGISRVSFHQKDTQLIGWPNWTSGGSQGIASLWDVSVGEIVDTIESLPAIIKAFGREELNEDSQAVPTVAIGTKLSLIDNLNSEPNLAKFFRWLQEFPSLRSDSPFRPIPSKNYVSLLQSQNNNILLEEAVRLAPRNAAAIAKRGAYRLSNNDSTNDATIVLAQSDITRASLLEPSNPEVMWYAAIVHESLGNIEKSENLYADARKLESLSLNQLNGLINLQEILNTKEPTRRELFSKAIVLAEKSAPETAKELMIKRCTISAENNNYKGAVFDWEIIKEWQTLPLNTDAYALAEIVLKAMEKEADRLVAENNHTVAIRLIKPAAIASLVAPNDTISPLVSKLIEWDNRENPPAKIISADSSWDYFDKGSNPGDEWFQPWFPAQGWSNGPAKLGYGDDGEVTRLSYGGDPSNVFPAYYFRHKFEITEETKKPFLFANIIRDDGMIVYLNGTEVIRNNMPLSEIVDHQTFSSGGVSPGNGELDANRFSLNGDLLQLGTNVIAAQVHQSNKTSSDVAFQLELFGSNQDAASYLKKILSDQNANTLLSDSINLVPKPQRKSAGNALSLVLGTPTTEEISKITLEESTTAIFIAQKLKKPKILNTIVEHRIAILEENGLDSFTSRAEALFLKRNQLIQSGAPRDEIDELQKTIASPPRNPDLSEKLIDLSDHYTASMFYYKSWWGGHERDDLRSLPEQYNNNIPFDLRGIVQLNSGKGKNNNTANEHWSISSRQITYPDAVKGINVKSKAQKIHFLMGLLFGWDIISGNRAAELTIHYDDDTKETIPILGKVDVFDYWDPDSIANLSEDKKGWEGTNHLGDRRSLTKYTWDNPHPEKTISHIDFESALDNTAPFLVAITVE
ncbi:NPCBM/NEW2 domain-containing protein [Verrucomicrobia bacterium]|nr:NPCBM/NEW2 domain-containing protein [Verrucomicrobiota bacterium]